MNNKKDKSDAYRTIGASPIKAPNPPEGGVSSSIIRPSGDGRSRGGKK